MSAATTQSARVHPHKTVQQIADEVGCSRRALFQAAVIRKEGCAELIAAVQAGRVSLRTATKLSKFDAAGQLLVLRETANDTPKHLAGIVNILWGNAGHDELVASGKLPPDDLPGLSVYEE